MNAKRVCLLALTLATLLASAAAIDADEKFSVRTIRGVYGFSGQGFLGGQPAAVAGLNGFDGHGGCDITAKLNASALSAAVIPLESVSCTYTVNADGTGTLNVTFAIGSFTSDFVIVDRGELHFVLSDPLGATVASGISKRRTGGPQ